MNKAQNMVSRLFAASFAKQIRAFFSLPFMALSGTVDHSKAAKVAFDAKKRNRVVLLGSNAEPTYITWVSPNNRKRKDL